ncbi:MAG: DISARM system helicase DrmA, partial [Bryobacteraceae bacterium]
MRVTWGDYRLEATETAGQEIWKRTEGNENVDLDVSMPVNQPIETEVPGSDGLFVALLVRPLGAAFSEAGLPAGAKTISVFLVNKRRPEQNDRVKDRAFAFQVRLEVHAEVPFLARPDIRGLFTNDWDDEVADLQYRDSGEYSVGHNVSTEACLDGGVCRVARTCWIPRAEVERVEPPATIPNVELGMRSLAGLADGADAWAKLSALSQAYRSQWIAPQRATLAAISQPKRRATAQILLNNADAAARRIERGIELLRDDPQALLAFRIANRAMADAAMQRRRVQQPEWFP